MASSPPQTLRKPIRELLRKRGEPIAQEISLQDRGDEVRMPLIKAAYEQYDEVPKTVTQWYDPLQNAVVIPLPDSDPSVDEQANLDSFGVGNLQGSGSIVGSGSQKHDNRPCHESVPGSANTTQVDVSAGGDR